MKTEKKERRLGGKKIILFLPASIGWIAAANAFEQDRPAAEHDGTALAGIEIHRPKPSQGLPACGYKQGNEELKHHRRNKIEKNRFGDEKNRKRCVDTGRGVAMVTESAEMKPSKRRRVAAPATAAIPLAAGAGAVASGAADGDASELSKTGMDGGESCAAAPLFSAASRGEGCALPAGGAVQTDHVDHGMPHTAAVGEGAAVPELQVPPQSNKKRRGGCSPSKKDVAALAEEAKAKAKAKAKKTKKKKKKKKVIPQMVPVSTVQGHSVQWENIVLWFKYICERHRVYRKWLARAPHPWSEDIIIQTGRLCNVFRQLDRESVYVVSEIIGTLTFPLLIFLLLLLILIPLHSR